MYGNRIINICELADTLEQKTVCRCCAEKHEAQLIEEIETTNKKEQDDLVDFLETSLKGLKHGYEPGDLKKLQNEFNRKKKKKSTPLF